MVRVVYITKNNFNSKYFKVNRLLTAGWDAWKPAAEGKPVYYNSLPFSATDD